MGAGLRFMLGRFRSYVDSGPVLASDLPASAAGAGA
jgi:hypothetical protein